MPEPRVALLTREYPPEVYGGAGVHVEYLARELARRLPVAVHAWGDPRPAPAAGEPEVLAYRPWGDLGGPAPLRSALEALSIDLAMVAGTGGADLVHSHTWYANLAGHLAALSHGIPHVATVHSLEPLRPWKAQQLEGGYAISCFAERTGLEGAAAVIAVSGAMREDVLAVYPAIEPRRVHVIHNGIDAGEFRPHPDRSALARHGVDPSAPSVLFVGRITRQKGLAHLLAAAERLEPAAQLVLAAGAPDTPRIAAEIEDAVARLRARRDGVVWIAERLERPDLLALLTHATVFVCPSIYEPLGIVNLEAMACETAVVATDTGGIPEVVQDGVTGLLVPFAPRADGSREPADPAAFAQAIAQRVDALLRDPGRAREMGRAGRARVLERFTWTAAAERTIELYRATARCGARQSS
jgi:starch synthase